MAAQHTDTLAEAPANQTLADDARTRLDSGTSSEHTEVTATVLARETPRMTPATLQNIGRYQVTGHLGSGGQGVVFVAWDPVLQREVAIKRTHERSRLAAELFDREAQLAAQIDHVNVCRVFDVLYDGTIRHIVMEYVPGISLRAKLRDHAQGLPLAIALPILRQVACGLQAAHDMNVIHQDLKTENVLVTHSGEAKVTDFGIARRVFSSSDTTPGIMAGTPRAMSPEQTLGGAAGPSTDLFSFGVLCWEVLTGQSPFLAGTPEQTLTRVRSYEPPPLDTCLPTVPPALAKLIGQLLRKNPEERPVSASAALDVLLQLETQLLRLEAARQTSAIRRQVTLLAVELMSHGVAGVASRSIEERYCRMVEELAQGFGGTVCATLGSHYLISFGFPEYNEKATRCAAEVVMALRRWVVANHGTESATVHAGLHTDVVALDSSADAHKTLTSTRLAAAVSMLCDSAGPGEVLLSDECRTVLGDAASYSGDERLAFGRTQITASRLLELRGTGAAMADQDEAPLVARAEELEFIQSRLTVAREGHGGGILVSGEPGIGKSRLLRAVRHSTKAEDMAWFVENCSPQGKRSPLQMVLGFVSQALCLEDCKREALAESLSLQLQQRGLAPSQYLGPLCSLFGTVAPPEFALSEWLTSEKHRKIVLTSVADLFLELSQRQPIVLAVEDLHWADPSSLEFLGELIRRLEGVRLAVLATTRPEGAQLWSDIPTAITKSLSPLPAQAAFDLVRQRFDRLPRSCRDVIVERAGGNPLFLEMLAAAVAEQPSLAESLDLPPSIRELLLSRLQACGSALFVAQLAAVIGREFTIDLLTATAAGSQPQIRESVARLANHGLVRPSLESDGSLKWTFSHALVHDAAYDSLLPRERSEHHGRVLQVLLQTRADIVESTPELLAYHAENAGQPDVAVQHWQRAANNAVARSAHREARDFFGRALRQLSLLPTGTSRIVSELQLVAGQGVAALSSEGYGSETMASSFDRAAELCEELGHYPFEVFFGIWCVDLGRGNTKKVIAHVARYEELCRGTTDPSELLVCNTSIGFGHYYTPDFVRAEEYLRRALEVFEPSLQPSLTRRLGGSGGFYAHIISPLVLTVLGDVTRGEALAHSSVELARSIGHPFTLCETLALELSRNFELGRIDRIRDLSAELVQIAERYGFLLYGSIGAISQGWLTCVDTPENGDAALQLMSAGCAGFRASGMVIFYRQWLMWYIDGLRRLGRIDVAKQVVEESIELSRHNIDQIFVAELFRILGELELDQDPTSIERAREHFTTAIGRAADAKQRLFELRALLALEKLGECREQRLRELSAYFDVPEGFLPEITATVVSSHG